MTRAVLLLLLIVGAALAARASDVVAEPFPPAKLTAFYIERDDKAATVSVVLQGDALIYKTTLNGKVQEQLTLHPSADDWFQFIQMLNSAKVYKWSPKYYYPGQGPSWVIDFDMTDRKFKSEGTNEFPKEGDEAQPQANPATGPSVPFQLFWQAVLKLSRQSASTAQHRLIDRLDLIFAPTSHENAKIRVDPTSLNRRKMGDWS